jgi:hypothetical protein
VIKIKRFLIFCATFILIISICKNNNIVELEERDFIITIGIEEKDKNKFEVTTLSANMEYLQKNSYDVNKKYINCAYSDSVNNALEKIDNKLKKNMYLGHTQIIFLSNKLKNNKSSILKIEKQIRDNTQLNHKTKLIFVGNVKKTIESQLTPDLLNSLFFDNK